MDKQDFISKISPIEVHKIMMSHTPRTMDERHTLGLGPG